MLSAEGVEFVQIIRQVFACCQGSEGITHLF